MLVWLHPRAIGVIFVLIFNNGRAKHTCASIIVLKKKEKKSWNLWWSWRTLNYTFYKDLYEGTTDSIGTMRLRNRLMGSLQVVKFIGYESNFVSIFHYGGIILDY